MKSKKKTIREILYWSYANLAMAHSALARNLKDYDKTSYMIRAKLYKGLITGNMNIRTIFEDEKFKMKLNHACGYCGNCNIDELSIDHLVPRIKGGNDSGDNLILVCRYCNSSKNKQDLLLWYEAKSEFPPLLLLRRYLKLANVYFCNNNLMDYKPEEIRDLEVPFCITQLPKKYPKPDELKLWCPPKRMV